MGRRRTIAAVAAELGISERRLRGWVDRRLVVTLPAPRRGQPRLLTPDAVKCAAALAALRQRYAVLTGRR